jgi:biopolymer transport protein ExbD
MARRKNPDINAGSMADIAFLLLIFFLVTTTMDVDAGIVRKLPEKSDQEEENTIIAKQNNVLELIIDPNDKIIIKGKEEVQLAEIKSVVINFVDNGSGIGNPFNGASQGLACDYCKGIKDPLSSEHPNKAIILIQGNRNASYGVYISLQNAIESAYKELRDELSKSQFGLSYTQLKQEYKETGAVEVKEKIEYIRERYPKIISEPST